MKIGKVSEPILKRSVLKYLKPNNEVNCKGAAVGADCAFLSKIEAVNNSKWTDESGIAVATASVSGGVVSVTSSVSGSRVDGGVSGTELSRTSVGISVATGRQSSVIATVIARASDTRIPQSLRR